MPTVCGFYKATKTPEPTWYRVLVPRYKLVYKLTSPINIYIYILYTQVSTINLALGVQNQLKQLWITTLGYKGFASEPPLKHEFY